MATLIALNYLKRLSKERSVYLLLLALPLALTLITGLAMGGGSGPGGAVAVPVAVVDLDVSAISEYLIRELDTEHISIELYGEEEARELTADRSVSAAVIIPEGFSAKLQGGGPVEITVVRADLRESPGLVEQQVNSLLYRIRANALAAHLGEEAGGGNWEEIFNQAARKWQPSPAVSVAMENVSVVRHNQIPTGNRQSSPGYVVMFGMMTVTVGAASLLQEREHGTLSRLLSAPLTRFQLLLGKTLGLMTSGIVQMAILIAAGRLIFNVEWGQNLPALAMLVFTFSFASTGFGMMLAAISRTRAQAETVGVASVLLMAMLGGTWWPVEVLPSYMQVVSRIVPSGWAMQGFVDLIMRGADMGQVALPVLMLFAFGAVFLSLGLVLFKT